VNLEFCLPQPRHCASAVLRFLFTLALLLMQLRVTKGADKLLSYRKEGSPRVTFNCGICYDRMYRQTEATDGSVLMKARTPDCLSSWKRLRHLLVANPSCLDASDEATVPSCFGACRLLTLQGAVTTIDIKRTRRCMPATSDALSMMTGGRHRNNRRQGQGCLAAALAHLVLGASMRHAGRPTKVVRLLQIEPCCRCWPAAMAGMPTRERAVCMLLPLVDIRKTNCDWRLSSVRTCLLISSII